MSSLLHTLGGAAARALTRARRMLSDLRAAIREARDLEARLSGQGYPLLDW